MSWIKVISINVVLTFALIGILLLSPPIIFYLYEKSGAGKVLQFASDIRVGLSLYEDYPWASKHFDEFRKLKSKYYDYITWRSEDFHGETITIKNGIRATFNDENTRNSDTSYWFFGGSTTWGTGVTDELTYPSIFAKRNTVNAINYGVYGYIARQSLAYFQNLIISGDNDFKASGNVVFYDGVNEVTQRCRKEISGLGTAREEQIRFLTSTDGSKWSFQRTFSQLVDLMSNLTRRFLYRNDGNADFSLYSCSSNPKRASEIAESLVKIWQQASILAKENGMNFYAVLQPVAYLGEANISYLNLNSVNDEDLSEQFKVVYPIIKKLAKEADINFIDLSSSFNGCDNCYIDFCHVSPQGHDLLITELSKTINSL